MGRTKTNYVVLEVRDAAFHLVATVASTDEARRWLKKKGAKGGIYQIAGFRGGPVTVDEKMVPRRKLVPMADAPASPAAEPTDAE